MVITSLQRTHFKFKSQTLIFLTHIFYFLFIIHYFWTSDNLSTTENLVLCSEVLLYNFIECYYWKQAHVYMYNTWLCCSMCHLYWQYLSWHKCGGLLWPFYTSEKLTFEIDLFFRLKSLLLLDTVRRFYKKNTQCKTIIINFIVFKSY